MRIHSDILTSADIFSCVRAADLSDVWVDKCESHSSRSRRYAFEVRLAADPATHARSRNTGRYGAEDARYSRQGAPRFQGAATYDEHGRWMAELFRLDPNAIVGPYKGVSRFNTMTNRKYHAPDWRQTSCRHCNHDVEGDQGAVSTDWRDRGNNTHCASGMIHSGRTDY